MKPVLRGLATTSVYIHLLRMYIYLGACESVRMRLCMCLDFKGQYYLCQYTSGSNNQKAINFPRDYFLVVTSLALLVLNLRSLIKQSFLVSDPDSATMYGSWVSLSLIPWDLVTLVGVDGFGSGWSWVLSSLDCKT